MLEFLDNIEDPGECQDACIAHLEAVRWPRGVVCPRCGAVGTSQRWAARAGYWQCSACRKQFNVLNATPLQGTRLPLRLWFHAIVLAGEGGDISALSPGIGAASAQYLGQRIAKMTPRERADLRALVGVGRRHSTSPGVQAACAHRAATRVRHARRASLT